MLLATFILACMHASRYNLLSDSLTLGCTRCHQSSHSYHHGCQRLPSHWNHHRDLSRGRVHGRESSGQLSDPASKCTVGFSYRSSRQAWSLLHIAMEECTSHILLRRHRHLSMQALSDKQLPWSLLHSNGGMVRRHRHLSMKSLSDKQLIAVA